MFKNKNNIQENNFQNNDFDVGAGMNFDFNENTDSSFNGDNQGTPMPNLNGTPLVSNKKQKKEANCICSFCIFIYNPILYIF